jgi:hypothetical protein
VSAMARARSSWALCLAGALPSPSARSGVVSNGRGKDEDESRVVGEVSTAGVGMGGCGYGGRKTCGAARKICHVLCKHATYHGLATSFLFHFCSRLRQMLQQRVLHKNSVHYVL